MTVFLCAQIAGKPIDLIYGKIRSTVFYMYRKTRFPGHMEYYMYKKCHFFGHMAGGIPYR